MILTVTETAPPSTEMLFAIDNGSWQSYELLLHDTSCQNVRITYDRGRMVLLKPSLIHEKLKILAGRLIEFACFELDIPIASFGSTTWKRQDLAKGLEADECYYVQNEPRVRGRTDVDLKNDPPPDLAVEVDITHCPIDRPSVYAALGVRELWRFDGERFEFVRRSSASAYEPIPHPDALPFMTATILDGFIKLLLANENAGLKEFRNWLSGLNR